MCLSYRQYLCNFKPKICNHQSKQSVVPVFFQHQINENTRLGVWKIEESEEFFKGNVPLHRDVTHPHKRLQHLAGRFLLQFLFPAFPYELIQIADTRKPFLANERFHFSISHCGDFAAAIVSRTNRVGIDVELVTPKVLKILPKFLSQEEQQLLQNGQTQEQATLCWSAKEAVFKWYGGGAVDFRAHIQLEQINTTDETVRGWFTKTNQQFSVHYRQFNNLVLSWIFN